MIYRPILRFKRGELNALRNLPDKIKANVMPLFNIRPIFNPLNDNGIDRAFDQRIEQDASSINSIWNGYSLAVDLNDIAGDARCAKGIHPVRYFFDHIMAAKEKADVWAVLRLESDDDYIAAVASVCTDYNTHIVFRMTPDDLATQNIDKIVAQMLKQCSANIQQTDFIVDMGYIDTTGRSIITARGSLSAVPFASNWRSLVLVAGSFPENLSNFVIGVHSLARHEWSVWLANQKSVGRDVEYGDYATIHPIPVDENLDPKTMNPTASVRYTFEDTWILIRGQGIRTKDGPGFSQFFNHADTIVNMPQYRGKSFSYGDAKIDNIHARSQQQGNLETWITIGVNHHIEEIVYQFSSLPSLSK